jgi:hypothetical protein
VASRASSASIRASTVVEAEPCSRRRRYGERRWSEMRNVTGWNDPNGAPRGTSTSKNPGSGILNILSASTSARNPCRQDTFDAPTGPVTGRVTGPTIPTRLDANVKTRADATYMLYARATSRTLSNGGPGGEQFPKSPAGVSLYDSPCPRIAPTASSSGRVTSKAQRSDRTVARCFTSNAHTSLARRARPIGGISVGFGKKV